MFVHKYMDENSLVAIMAGKRSVVVKPRVDVINPLCTVKGALKLRADVMRSPKHGYQSFSVVSLPVLIGNSTAQNLFTKTKAMHRTTRTHSF